MLYHFRLKLLTACIAATLLIGFGILLLYIHGKYIKTQSVFEYQSHVLNLWKEDMSELIMGLSQDDVFLSDSPKVSDLEKAGLGALKRNGEVFQFRVLTAQGQELVKYNRLGPSQFEKVSDEKLQNKSDKDYFKLLTSHGSDSVVFSGVTLNEEFGKISQPEIPTVRVMIQLSKPPALVIILNVDASRLIGSLFGNYNNSLGLLNHRGEWVFYDDPKKTFLMQRGESSKSVEISSICCVEGLIAVDDYYAVKRDVTLSNYSEHELIIDGFKKKEVFSWFLVYLVASLFTAGVSFFIIEALSRASRDRKALKEEHLYTLKSEQAFLQAVGDLSVAGLLVFDLSNNAYFVNQRFCDLLGLKKEDVLGVSLGTVELMSNRLIRAEEGNTQYQTEFRMDDGDVRFAQVERIETSIYSRDYTMYSVVDVTNELVALNDAKLLNSRLKESNEKLTQASDLKSRFLANMSHEIRTPLNGILGMLQVLSLSRLNKDQTSTLNTALESTEGLLRILNDILDLSKIESNQLTIELLPFDFEKFIQDVYKTYRAGAAQKNLHFIVNMAPLAHSKYVGDRFRLKQVIGNLIGNAIKFTDKGLVRISVTEDQNNIGNITIEVEDTGIGIEQSKLDSVFKEFEQADDSITKEFGGTGLGLSISRKLAHLMGAEISASSMLGAGSKFSLKLQLVPEGLDDETDGMSLEGKSILILDNDVGFRNRMVSHLHRWNAHYDFAQTFEEANIRLNGAAAMKSYFDVLLIDGAICDKQMLAEFKEVRKRLVYHAPKALVVGETSLSSSHFEKEKDILVMPLPLMPRRLFAFIQSQANRQPPPEEASLGTSFSEEIKKVKPFLQNLKVLVCEDNTVNQLVIKKFLQKVDCQVTVASNGKEGLELFQKEDFDFILMDYHMPVMDGLEATREIRKENSHIPIIAITAAAFESDRENGFSAGVTWFVSKPLVVNEFYEGILKAIALSKEKKVGQRV